MEKLRLRKIVELSKGLTAPLVPYSHSISLKRTSGNFFQVYCWRAKLRSRASAGTCSCSQEMLGVCGWGSFSPTWPHGIWSPGVETYIALSTACGHSGKMEVLFLVMVICTVHVWWISLNCALKINTLYCYLPIFFLIFLGALYILIWIAIWVIWVAIFVTKIKFTFWVYLFFCIDINFYVRKYIFTVPKL